MKSLSRGRKEMKLIVVGAAAAFLTSPLAAQQVSVGTGDWSNIPPVISRGHVAATPRVVDDIAAAAVRSSCTNVARDVRHVNLSVPFLIRFADKGEVQQIVVQKLGCPKVESLVGGTLLQMAKEGEYRPTGENQVGWYRGQFEISTY
jgi:hypothetical protein